MTSTLAFAPISAPRMASGIEGSYVRGTVQRPADEAHEFIADAIRLEDSIAYVFDHTTDLALMADDEMLDRLLAQAILAGRSRILAGVVTVQGRMRGHAWLEAA